MTDAVLELYERARDRVEATRGTWACITPGCGTDMTMRASGFHDGPGDAHCDDLLKCPGCRAVVVHGQRPTQPERERVLRRRVARDQGRPDRWRRVDFVDDWPTAPDGYDTRDQRLRDLGYL